ncbi:ATP-binding protein [Foetidibacter luteolus]|uniref:ATP-binding protein n=1 Tax=Foetidibacter luteolus TaxID=2608880 RepID=UPI00129B2D7E|nr:ATP-binding protein [Foetidibacter luteolus]
MSEAIDQLKEALSFSPENIPLRLHVADMMLKENLLDDAAGQFNEVLKRNYGNAKARKGLASVYFRQKKFSTAIIVFEELWKQDELTWDEMVQYVRCLVKENSMSDAVEVYKKVLALNPSFTDVELDAILRTPSAGAFNDDFEFDDDDDFAFDDEAGKPNFLMEKPDLKFEDVGGMEQVKREIAMKIIQPLKNPDLYKAFGKKIGGGILLYGPPGCGKTYLARATAGEINAGFINIGLHDILDMWMGNSEKNLHAVFEFARKNAPCVVFFDEVDALGASRSDLRQSSMRHVINQFLAELDGVHGKNDGVLVLAATNAPWSVDSAFRRPGRFDRIIFVAPPDEQGRVEILKQHLKNKPVEPIDINAIAKVTDGYSGADLQAIVDIATELKLEESFTKGSVEKITSKDLQKAVKQHRPTTTEWFNTARNYALYANESGLYDEILKYLKIKK